MNTIPILSVWYPEACESFSFVNMFTQCCIYSVVDFGYLKSVQSNFLFLYFLRYTGEDIVFCVTYVTV